MIGFWTGAAVLLLAAYALFAPALVSKFGRSGVDRRRLNLMLHRQRGEELAEDLPGQDLGALQAESDQDLLGELAHAEPSGEETTEGGRGVLLASLLAAPLLGVLIYSMLGRYDLADFKAEPESSQKTEVAPEIRDMIEHLAERLKKEPGDLKGWVLLGRSLQQTEQHDRAVEAYRNALKLDPENLDIRAFYAEALGESRGGAFAGDPAAIAAEILAKNPRHHTALWLAGAAAAQGGDSRGAIAFLETLRSEYPADSPNYQHLTSIIGDLTGEQPTAGETSRTVPASDMPATGGRASITVKVTLAAALASKSAPDDAVFIFARAASGPPMPLAIVRKKVQDLPVEVTLDDSMSMVQGMNLSAFEKLVIGARVSKTGQALPRPGDLQGMSPPVKIENGGHYSVEIAEEIN